MNKLTEAILHDILPQTIGRNVRIFPDEDTFMDGILTSYSISDGILYLNLHNGRTGSFNLFDDNKEYHQLLDKNDSITLISNETSNYGTRSYPTRISILRYMNGYR